MSVIRKFSFVILTMSLGAFFSCSKSKDAKITELNCKVTPFASDNELIGRWKWKSSSVSVYGSYFCDYLGDLTRDTITNPMNFVVEFLPNGTVEFYRNDSLVQIYFTNSVSKYLNAGQNNYKMNIFCELDNLTFTLFDSDSMFFNNPNFDFNLDITDTEEQTIGSTFYRIP